MELENTADSVVGESRDGGSHGRYKDNAYVKSFDDTVSFALNDNANLWTAEEKQLLLQCKPEVLSEGARVILSRLSLRLMKWIESTSISHYVVQLQRDATTDGLVESLELLKSKQFIECLQSSTSFETAFEAVESCFLLDDLTRLFKRITTSKNSAGNNKVMNKEGILEAVFNAVRTQRTLFGQSLTHKFASTVLDVLKELQPAVPWKQRSSFPLSTYTSRSAQTTSSSAGAKLVLLRIQPQVLHLLRRCQRIYQISCNAGGNGYSGNTSSSPSNNFMSNPGAAAANNTSAASSGFASVLQPLEFNAPLLVIFNKVQYPPYVQHCRPQSALASGAERSAVAVGTNVRDSRIFKSQLAFQRWEGAVELHAACLDKSIQDVLLDERSTARLRSLLDTFHSTEFLRRYLAPKLPGSCGGGSDVAGSAVSYLFLLSQVCGADADSATTSGDTAAAAGVTGTSVGPSAEAAPAVVVAKAKGPQRKTVVNAKVDLSALSRAHILAVLSLLSYHHHHHHNSHHHNRHQKQERRGVPADNRGAEEMAGSVFADYMIKFDAGTQLAYACSDGASQLEKEPYRQYSFALLLQELLLLLPYLPHRRGLWYKRLCINYAHLQLHRCALRACLRCLADPLVNVSDKTELQTRAAALTAKLMKQQTVSKNTYKPTSCDGSMGDVKQEGAAPSTYEHAVFALELDFPAVRILQSGETSLSGRTAAVGTATAPDGLCGDDIEADLLALAATAGTGNPNIRSKRKAAVRQDAATIPPAVREVPTEASALLKNNNIPTALWLVNTLPGRYGSGGDLDASTHAIHAIDVLCTSILHHILATADASKLDAAASALAKEVPSAHQVPPPTRAAAVFATHKSPFDAQGSSSGPAPLAKAAKLGTASSGAGAGAGTGASSKRKLSQSTPASNAKVSKTETTSVIVEWSCSFCTFINTKGHATWCEVCLQKRTITSAVTTVMGSSTKSASAANTTTTASSAQQARPQSSALFVRAVSCNDVVDLVSDSDDGGDAEPIFIPSTSSAIARAGKGKDAAGTSVMPGVPTVPAVPVLPPSTSSSSADASSRRASHVGASHVSVSAEAEAGKRFLYAAQEQLRESWGDMQRHLQTLIAQRCGGRSVAPASTGSSLAHFSDNGAANVVEDALGDALNLHSRSAEDEEHDDLISLGLLPQSAVKTEGVTEHSSRQSLEDLIPAPPFFVVNGKRTGDPSSRKGKSKFCGMNDELVNVETFVMQKCFAVDPDDCEGEAAAERTADGAEAEDLNGCTDRVAGRDQDDEGEGVAEGCNNTTAHVTTMEAAAGAAAEVGADGESDCESDTCDDCAADPAELPSPDSTCLRRSQRSRASRSFTYEPPRLEDAKTSDDADEEEEQKVGAGSTPARSGKAMEKAGSLSAQPSRGRAAPAPKVQKRIDAKVPKALKAAKVKRGGVPYSAAVEGGGWQGWHCEGAVFQSLFGLLMWDVLFTCPCCPATTSKTEEPRSPAHGCTTAATGCSVFVTPFQDAPLDLGHRSFFRSRRVRILARIAQISAFSTHELIAELGAVYRAHYGESCRGVHWGITLRLLQLMAVCMGPAAVAAVCRALAVNYKHFTGGAPDLMLVRVQRRVLYTVTRSCPANCSCEDSGGGFSGGGTGCAGDCEVREAGAFTLVDVSELLGVDWASQMQSPVVLSKRQRYPDTPASEDLLLGGPVSGPNHSAESAPNGELHRQEREQGLEQEQEEGQEQGQDEEEGDSMYFAEEEQGEPLGQGELVAGSEESDHLKGGNTRLLDRTLASAPLAAQGYSKNEHIRDLFLPLLAPTCEMGAPGGGEVPQLCGTCRQPCVVQRQYTYDYKLQAKYIEVKGPTDSLMFRQRVWLHMLNSASRSADAEQSGLFDAYVCHVKE